MDAGRVLAREAQPQCPAPAALLLRDLGGRGMASGRPPAQPPCPSHQRAQGEGTVPFSADHPRQTPMASNSAQLTHNWVSSPPPRNPHLLPPTTLILFPSPPHGHSPFYFLLYHTGKAEKRVRRKRRNEEELKWQQRGKRRGKVGDSRKQKRGSPEAPGNAATGAGREAPPSA